MATLTNTTNQWEYVRKNNKKNQPQTAAGKSQKKISPENMPRIDASPPLKESATIYDAFLAKEKSSPADGERERKTAPPLQGSPGKKPGTGQRKKTPGGSDKKDSPTTLQQAVQNIDVQELETLLARDQVTFPENPSVWLKDLASILNLKMDKVAEMDPVFHEKPHEFPLSELPNRIQKVLLGTVNQCSTKTLELFLVHCVHSMITDMGKGISTYGYRMFIQLLLYNKPDIVLDTLPKYEELLNASTNRPLRGLSILWAVGQAGVKNLSNGLKVWLRLMLPVLHVRALSSYCVEYLEGLFKLHTNDIASANNVITPQDFFVILDNVYTPQTSFPTNLRKKLLTVYPKVKQIAFGSEPKTNLRKFFHKFLNRCTPKCAEPLQTELLACLVTSLESDKHCFSEWRQCYTRYMPQSGVLLRHLSDDWERARRRLDGKLVQETIRSFHVTNDEISSSTEGHDACVVGCKALLAKMSKVRFPWRSLLLLFFALCGGVLAYDVYVHSGYKNSKTHQLLTETGILLFLSHVWNRVTLYSGKAWLWLQDNVPYYYAKTCTFVAPYLQLFWEKLYDFGIWIAEVTKPHRDWLNVKIPELLEWIHAKVPWLWDATLYYCGIVWTALVTYSLIVWQFVAYYVNIASAWLLENVFTGSLSPENILKTLSSVLLTIQSYLVAAAQWCYQLIMPLVSSSASSSSTASSASPSAADPPATPS